MKLTLNAISIIWIISTLIVLYDGWLCLVRRKARGSIEFAFFNFAIAWYIFFAAFELMSTELSQVLFFTHLEYIAIVLFPLLMLNFTFKFLDIEPSYRKQLFITLGVIAFVELVFQWTTAHHGLFYRNPYLEAYGNLFVLRFERGPIYIFQATLQGLSLVSSMIVFVIALSKAQGTIKNQLLIILIVFSLFFLLFVLYLFSAIPVPYDVNPFAFTLMSIITSYMLLQGDMLQFSPIERGRIFMSMQESCIIVDENGHIVDINRRVKELLSFLPDDIIGKKATDVFSLFPLLTHALQHPSEQEMELYTSNAGKPEWLRIRISPLHNSNQHPTAYAIFFEDTSEQHRMIEQLEQYAMYDDLTGLFNRRQFYKTVHSTLQTQLSKSTTIAIIMIDIDNFKEVNDLYGHAVGDTVLQFVAQTLKANLEPGAVLGRFGGDEFIVFLLNIDRERAYAIAEKLRASMATMSIPADIDFPIQGSFGVALSQIYSLKDVDILVSSADNAMYEAKHSGGNCVKLS